MLIAMVDQIRFFQVNDFGDEFDLQDLGFTLPVPEGECVETVREEDKYIYVCFGKFNQFYFFFWFIIFLNL